MDDHRREPEVHCYRMLGSLHEAEDLVQETYLKAWRARDSFNGQSSVRTLALQDRHQHLPRRPQGPPAPGAAR